VSRLAEEVADAGGAEAPAASTARLREALSAALRHGRDELALPRSGYGEPVEVGLAAADGVLLAATPADAALRADAEAVNERAWLLVAATVAALVELAEPGPPGDLQLRAGELPGGFLVLAFPGRLDADLVELAFDEHAANLNRLRARAHALPPGVVEDVELRAPIGEGHPLRVAEAVARLGGHPADSHDVEAHEDALLALLGRGDGVARPHEDPDPGRRVARRILQRLDGMGKWGGYHTEFAHLARGFAGNDRALAMEAGEALLSAGLLAEKPSVGQRHVYLNPRRAAEIRRMIETGEVPSGMTLPTK
jgi:hypothetical protein